MLCRIKNQRSHEIRLDLCRLKVLSFSWSDSQCAVKSSLMAFSFAAWLNTS